MGSIEAWKWNLKRTVIGIVGSPNRNGRTNQVVPAALQGSSQAGASTEVIQMADHVVLACKDCLPWVCASAKKCSHEDAAFEFLSQELLSCDALVFGSPIYWGDTSDMVHYLFLKAFRIFARLAPFQGFRQSGLAWPEGREMGWYLDYAPCTFFQVMQMRALEPLPVNRFNFDARIKKAGQLGSELAGMAQKRAPFGSLEERLLW
jgi:hypothetical protein